MNLSNQQGVVGAGARLHLMPGQPLGQQHPQRHVGADRGVLGGLLAEAVAQGDRVDLGRGRAGEDQLLPVAGSTPPKIRSWYRLPRWRIPVRSAAARFLDAMSGTVHGTATG